MILIGDPLQLPATVKSRKAGRLDFGKSLYERFIDYFKKQFKKRSNPVLMLSLQYRMHRDICQLPSRSFYDNRLQSHPSTDRPFRLRPYIVFDVQGTMEDKNPSRSTFNEKEAEFVVSVVKAVNRILPVDELYTIGIVTPYQGQKQLISSKLDEMKNELRHYPDVNTVDGFQGQERDIMIVSCVRAGGKGIGFFRSRQRINVALTRARFCNIICLSTASLKSDKLWAKIINDADSRDVLIPVRPNREPNDIIALLLAQ